MVVDSSDSQDENDDDDDDLIGRVIKQRKQHERKRQIEQMIEESKQDLASLVNGIELKPIKPQVQNKNDEVSRKP